MDNLNADLETAVDLLAVDPELQKLVDETVIEAAEETEGGAVSTVSAESESVDVGLLASKRLAFGILKGVGFAAKLATGAPVEFSETEKQEFADKVAPAFAKYSGNSLGWMERYSEEIDAVNAIGTIGTSVYVQIAVHQAEMQRIAQEQSQGGESGDKSE